MVDERRKVFRWELRYTATVPGGEVKRVSRMFAGTEVQARLKLGELRTTAQQRGVPDGQATVGAALGSWLASQKLAITEGAWRRYDGAARRYVTPRWAGVKLRDVTRAAVLGWYTELRKQYGHSTIRMCHTVLKGALGGAVDVDLIPMNPLVGLAVKRTEEEKAVKLKALTPEEAGRFFKAATAERAGAVLAFCLTTGVRIGEALALRWSAVNLETGQVRIVATRSGGESGGVYESAPKSSSGRRTLYCAGDALSLLQGQRARLVEEREARLPGWQDSEYVFFNLRGKPYRPDAMKRYMARICKAAGVSINVHGLWHTAISLLLMGGADIAAVSRAAGHSRVSTTMDLYRNVYEQEQHGLTLNFG